MPHATPQRFLTGLIGAPIKHSASPAMHQAAGAALGLELYYHLIEVAGLDPAGLAATLDGVRRVGFAGVNVTFPYKEMVVGLLDDLSPAARGIGAVNTVVAGADGKLTGHNTDATGFSRAVRDLVAASDRGPVALIGAGGVGKAAGFALAGLGVSAIRIFDRDMGKAAALAQALERHLPSAATTDLGRAIDGAAGLVNGTPVGMWPSVESPVPDDLLHADLWVADAVYSPLWTPLLNAAKAKGAKTMTGRDLAVFQAADAFELFTGAKPSVTVIEGAFDAVMEQRKRAAAQAA